MIHINHTKKVIVGMSGGVDSSVAAWLLKNKGYEVEGLFMKNWEDDDMESYCSSRRDLMDAEMVCDQIGIILHKVNFSLEYWNNVFLRFLKEFQKGRTPNPDILCNKEIKFKSFLNFSIENLGADYIATGHYARCVQLNNRNHLLRGVDKKKDQSYFLYALNNSQLEKSIFPIGNMTKKMVRYIAYRLNLANANKKESMGICFIGKKNFRNFLSRYIPPKPGDIISIENKKKIGSHLGLMYYTIGQRKGLGIGGISRGMNGPWYVAEKDLIKNHLIVAQNCLHPKLFSRSIIVNCVNWIGEKLSDKEHIVCTVKTRYLQKETSCVLLPISKKRLQITLNQPVFAVTPGQSAVFYLKDRCLGGGIIESVHS